MDKDAFKQTKALIFDFIGTTVDWLTPVSHSLQENAPLGSNIDWVQFAHKWRREFFVYLAELANNDSELIPFNDVYNTTLSRISADLEWTPEQRMHLIDSWRGLIAWEDTAEGLRRLGEQYIVCVLSNGSTRTLIDASKRNKMQWDMFFASDIVGAYKPSPKMYQTAIKALNLDPSECAMVAAHAYDLKAAASHGMKTIYISRDTEDIGINLQDYRFDLTINKGGLLGLVSALIG